VRYVFWLLMRADDRNYIAWIQVAKVPELARKPSALLGVANELQIALTAFLHDERANECFFVV